MRFNKITGGKLISSTVLKKKAGIATKAFRAAANSLKNSDNWLGDYFRKKRSKGGTKYAIIATARKIFLIAVVNLITESKIKNGFALCN